MFDWFVDDTRGFTNVRFQPSFRKTKFLKVEPKDFPYVSTHDKTDPWGEPLLNMRLRLTMSEKQRHP